jgi:hydrogenase-4 component F
MTSLLLPLAVPLVGAAIILWFRNPDIATRLALAFGVLEFIALGNVVWRVHRLGSIAAGRYLRADGLTSFFLVNLAFVSLLAIVYATGYMRHPGEGRFGSQRWFYAMLFLFIFTMAGVCLSSNLGLLWIMMEATTLASALLVGFYNTEGAVEAGWKYLIVCTVGIAFALFGTIVLYLAAVKAGLNPQTALDWAVLMEAGPRLQMDPNLLKLALVFVMVGYGTKIGFVPMHSWLPDAHAEAPSPISALLSGVLLNCAMYAVMRYDAIVSRAAGTAFSHSLLLLFGSLSMVVAGLLILVQRDLKRLLAYSSIEHMGIISIGVGLGGPLGLYGALLHSFNHSMAKSLLFFSAGNVRQSFGTSRMDRIGGMSRSLPHTSAALVVGSLAIVGLPPFSLFVSEFAIVSEAFAQSRYVIATLFLVMLSVVFGGFAYHLLRLLYGEAKAAPNRTSLILSESITLGITAACLLLFGARIPHVFDTLVHEAMAALR